MRLDLYPLKPVFAEHTLRAGTMGRAGVFDESAWLLTDEGLYGEAELQDNEFGDYCRALIESGRGFWSAGTMPHQMRVSSSGLVELFPIVEGSVVSSPSSPKGSTTVKHIRSVMPVNGEDETMLVRSYWVGSMPARAWGDGVAAPAETPAPVPAADEGEFKQKVLTQLTALGQALHDAQNLRALPSGNPVADAKAPAPVVKVSSRYDGYSPFTLMFYWEARRIEAARQGRQAWVSDDDRNQFLRALGTEIARVAEEEDHKSLPAHMRSLDATALDLWRKRGMPNLRANELMQATLAASGDELVPTSLSSVAWYAFMMESRVASLFETVIMPTNPYDLPTISGGPTMRRVLTPTDQSQGNLASSVRQASKPTTGKKTLTALEQGVGALVLVENTLFSDAGLSVADVLATQWQRRMAFSIDHIIINGSEAATTTNNSHYGADPTNTDYDRILLVDGLRAKAISDDGTYDTAVDAGSLASTDFVVNQTRLGSRGNKGLDIKNVVHIVDPGVAYKALQLSDYATFNQVGERAALLTGEVASVYNIPLVVSDAIEYTTVDTYRIPSTHDVTSGDCGTVLSVWRPGVKIGRLRDIPLEMGVVPHTGMYGVSGSVRLDVAFMEDAVVSMGYGVTV